MNRLRLANDWLTQQAGDTISVILTHLDGETVAHAWPSMDDNQRDKTVAQHAYHEMAVRDEIQSSGESQLDPSTLLTNFQELKMDWSTLRFYDCDMRLGNLVVNCANIERTDRHRPRGSGRIYPQRVE